MEKSFYINKIAVLGAGVMGAQIAAHCVNAGINTMLFDLTAKQGRRSALAENAIQHLKKLKPTPLATPTVADCIIPCNYDDDINELSACDLIIEAIGEKMEWKNALYQLISPHIRKDAVFVSNTSGLSINALAENLPEDLRKRFCGVHFFNPPRYMHLAELIPANTTETTLLDNLETWLTRYLGKGVVRAKDTPNFIANRIGVFSLLSTMHYAKIFNLGFDEVDALTGTLLGRPKSATFRTIDVVGLDTLHHVVHTMQEQLQADPWHALYTLPDWMQTLIQKGALGQKAGVGIYRKKGKAIEVFCTELSDYRLANKGVDEDVLAILKNKDPVTRMQQLLACENNQAKFLSAYFCDLLHYSAYHLDGIAQTVADVDRALCWGFGWQTGPFETWQMAGVSAMRAFIMDAIRQKHAYAKVDMPEWVSTISTFYDGEASFCPSQSAMVGRSHLAVYKRQFTATTASKQQILFENDGLYVWRRDDIAIVSFKTKANTIGQSVLDGLSQALDCAEQQQLGLVLYQHDTSNFSSGADLRQIYGLMQSNHYAALEKMVETLQRLALRLKYSSIPTVAAIRGRVLGGGCELMLQCDAIVAAMESYPGLVEVGVGFIPAGTGSKAFAKRAAMRSQDGELMEYVQKYFEQIATATVASSALDGLKRGFLKRNDDWVMHVDEVLPCAIAKVKLLQNLNYQPPLQTRFPVVGRQGKARLQMGLVNWLEGGFISEHDYFLANQLAHVICGGDVNSGEYVDDEWMIRLEREAFMILAQTDKTTQRVAHLLETGKPLRN